MATLSRPDAKTPWNEILATALSTARGLDRRAQLATIRGPAAGDYEGRPACRNIQIRGFKNDKLYFVTDARSGKVDDVNQNPKVEICWFDSQNKWQFRVGGTGVVQASCERSDTVWEGLSEGERLWWAWPTPGKLWEGSAAFDVVPQEKPPDHFCVFEIVPERVEVLDLSVVPFHREVHRVGDEKIGNTEWIVERINP